MEMVTREEKQELERKLERLHAARPEIAERIAEARAQGDLKENADYHAAREDQALAEAEIRRLEERLASVTIIDEGAHKELGVVFLGATVRVREEGEDDDELIRLVGESTGKMDGDVFEATASSPFGEALLRARVGEVVAVRGPRGVTRFEILEIL